MGRLPTSREGPLTLPADKRSRRRVVVVGGGLGGIAAATVLAQRGYPVTLLEQAPHLGGKVGGWTTDVLGERVPLEHGFHGFFHQYFNLRGLLQSAGALTPQNFTPASSYPIAFADKPTEHFGTSTTLFPLNLVDVIWQSPSLRFMDFRDANELLQIARYEGQATFDRFDDVDFATWAKQARVPPAMVDLVLRPFGETTLNRSERLSTAEAIKFFHFYFAGSPTGLGFDLLRRDSMTAVVEPLTAQLVRHGATVRTSAPVSRLLVEDNRVRGVVVGADRPKLTRLPLPPPDPQRHPDERMLGDWPLLLDRARGVAIDLRCTHQGCPVRPERDAGALTGFLCPCHGGRFNALGSPVAGPPKAPLAQYPLDGDTVVVAEQAGERLEADVVVLASDTRGARALLTQSGLADRIETRALQEAEAFCVVRVWLDRATDPGRSAFYTTSRFRYLDSLAIYSAFQEPYLHKPGSVVELHAYAIPDELVVAPEAIADAMQREMLVVLPELAGARVLHREVQLQRSFTRYAPGDHRLRPTTTTKVSGLLLAGDWVRVDAPVALMEGAVVSGKLAANVALRADGLAEEEIPIVASRGPLA